jgi:NADH-quinone oxidoreductase subunit E
MAMKLQRILEKYEYKKSSIIQILQEIQDEYRYLPREVLDATSKLLRMPLSTVYSIATFYTAFSLTPRGKHLCTVCMGTACHVRGAPDVLTQIEERLQIKSGKTSEDKMFSLETVNCLGACALAPIVVIDGRYYGQTTVDKVNRLLDTYYEKEAA